jgi:hypothetical protein
VDAPVGRGIGENPVDLCGGLLLQYPLDQGPADEPAHGVGHQVDPGGTGLCQDIVQQAAQVFPQGFDEIPCAVAGTVRGAVVVAVNPQGPGWEFAGVIQGVFAVEQFHGPVPIDPGKQIRVPVVPDQADQRAFKDEEIRVPVRAGAHLGGAEIEAVVGLVHRGFHGPLGSGVSPHVDDGQVFFHGVLPYEILSALISRISAMRAAISGESLRLPRS